MSSIIEQAEHLRDTVAAAVAALDVLVTLDGAGVKPQTAAAIVVQPPSLEFPTYGERDTSFSLILVAGPADHPLIALECIDQMLAALEAARLPLRSASPARYGLAGAGTLPAYEVTLYPF